MARQRCIPDNDAFSPTSHAARRRLFLEFHMRAIRFHAFGGPEVLSVDEVPTPKAGRGEVLVRVEAAWVNPVDYKIRNGGFVPADQLPMAAGREVAGVVAQCGAGTTGFSIGDRVRSEERRVGKEGVSTVRSWWSPSH